MRGMCWHSARCCSCSLRPLRHSPLRCALAHPQLLSRPTAPMHTTGFLPSRRRNQDTQPGARSRCICPSTASMHLSDSLLQLPAIPLQVVRLIDGLWLLGVLTLLCAASADGGSFSVCALRPQWKLQPPCAPASAASHIYWAWKSRCFCGFRARLRVRLQWEHCARLCCCRSPPLRRSARRT